MMYVELLVIYTIGMFPVLIAMAGGVVRFFAARRRLAAAR